MGVLLALPPLLLIDTEVIKSGNHLIQSKNHSSGTSQIFGETRNVIKQRHFGGKYIFGNMFCPGLLVAIKVVSI